MKTYQSIPYVDESPDLSKLDSNAMFYVFDKLDGSNIRSEWNRKRGFDKYGTRARLLGVDDEIFGEAIPLINNKFVEPLHEVFKRAGYERVTCYFEFFGPNSFAGWHADEAHEVRIIDIEIYKKGILHPKDFCKLTHNLPRAELVTTVPRSQVREIKEEVWNGGLKGVTFEGVVMKGPKILHHPVMVKAKSKAWISRLKDKCRGDEELFKQLV